MRCLALAPILLAAPFTTPAAAQTPAGFVDLKKALKTARGGLVHIDGWQGFTLMALTTTLYAQHVDVNGPHVVLSSLESRNWSNMTVEINGYWTFRVPEVPSTTTLCINATAFTVKASLQGGRDFEGIHFDPSTMKVKTVSLFAANGAPIRPQSVTSGMVKPLTRQEARGCVGPVRPQ